MTNPTTGPDPMIGLELKQKVKELEAALLDKHPSMPTLLQQIWLTLKKYPEQVTLIDEDEIQQIVKGLIVQTGVEFVATATKGGGSKSAVANIKKLGLGAF